MYAWIVNRRFFQSFFSYSISIYKWWLCLPIIFNLSLFHFVIQKIHLPMLFHSFEWKKSRDNNNQTEQKKISHSQMDFGIQFVPFETLNMTKTAKWMKKMGVSNQTSHGCLNDSHLLVCDVKWKNRKKINFHHQKTFI